jgi:hypothetical protein
VSRMTRIKTVRRAPGSALRERLQLPPREEIKIVRLLGRLSPEPSRLITAGQPEPGLAERTLCVRRIRRSICLC